MGKSLTLQQRIIGDEHLIPVHEAYAMSICTPCSSAHRWLMGCFGMDVLDVYLHAHMIAPQRPEGFLSTLPKVDQCCCSQLPTSDGHLAARAAPASW